MLSFFKTEQGRIMEIEKEVWFVGRGGYPASAERGAPGVSH
jgi:hypothetical protein